MLVVIQVSSVTSPVSRVTGEGTAPSRAPVFMVHSVTLLMENAPAEQLTAVSVTLVGLALTVACPAVMILGGQTVRMLVCVSTVECAIRYSEFLVIYSVLFRMKTDVIHFNINY